MGNWEEGFRMCWVWSACGQLAVQVWSSRERAGLEVHFNVPKTPRLPPERDSPRVSSLPSCRPQGTMYLIMSNGEGPPSPSCLLSPLRNATLPSALHWLQAEWGHSGCLHQLPPELRLPAGQVRRRGQAGSLGPSGEASAVTNGLFTAS